MADCSQCKNPRLCFVHFVHSGNQRVRVGWTHAWVLVRQVVESFLAQHAIDAKKRSAFRGALLSYADDALLHFYKLGLAGADHPLCIDKTVHVNGDPATVHEREVRVPDQPDMVCPVALNEKLFRMPPETENLAMTRHEFIFVHRRRLIRARHVCLARARTHTTLFRSVYLLGATANVRLSTYLCARFRFCLRFALLLCGAHL